MHSLLGGGLQGEPMKAEPIASGASVAESPDPRADARADMRLTRSLVIGIFILLTIAALYFARDFFMPVILAFLLALTLTPIVRFLRKHGVPEVVSATLLVLLSIFVFVVAGYLLSGPVIDLINNSYSIGQQLTERLAPFKRPLERVMDLAHQLEALTETSQEPGVQRVAVAPSGILSTAASNILEAGTSITIVFVLSLFLLASGTLFYEKIVQSFTSMTQKKRALRVVYDVEREISHYLLTVSLINAGLGTVIGLGLWGLGMPTPLVWGAAAALLNFLPYVGALMTVLLVAIIALISFDTIAYALLAPAFVVLCDIVEGQFVTPMVVGRRLEINAVAIFIAIAFWSWLWGFVGALMAVPLLVVIKVFCDHFEGLSHVGNFLAAQQSMAVDEEATENNHKSAP